MCLLDSRIYWSRPKKPLCDCLQKRAFSRCLSWPWTNFWLECSFLARMFVPFIQEYKHGTPQLGEGFKATSPGSDSCMWKPSHRSKPHNLLQPWNASQGCSISKTPLQATVGKYPGISNFQGRNQYKHFLGWGIYQCTMHMQRRTYSARYLPVLPRCNHPMQLGDHGAQSLNQIQHQDMTKGRNPV